MALVSTPTPTTDPEQLIENDSWFPDIDLVLLRDTVRIDPNVTLERLREAAVEAISSANRQLAVWKAGHVALGVESLAEVPAPSVNGESAKTAQYRRAVHSYTAADLSARLRDIGTTASGHDRADELEDAEGAHRRAAAWAIADIQDKRRTKVELI